TVEFIERQPFTYLHVFTYSERPGTAAAVMGEAVPVEICRERTRILRELSNRKNLDFRRRMIGRTLSSVTLEEPRMALTTNFLRVQTAEERQPNRMVDLAISAVTDNGLREQTLLPII
ncbi:MAG: tRNA (N(6)-L-threonylcarbamoyladenosine(37)-C(2))-methylthiotransferase MtaB, partial [Acidobacteriaceae bacterium]|nr:tRNA (N(6)-L-threonylcarbamoyladenosine(37)-C(2))-methylthiotransferase MtaB [Acidobacteriaceae bacterium]